MIDRRGLPKEIISDNDTNFFGAKKELFEMTDKIVRDVKINSLIADKGIRWTVNPP